MWMLGRTNVQALTLVAIVAAFPGTAAADPVTITGGHVEIDTRTGLVRGVLEGEDFFLSFGADSFRASIAVDCWPCTPGTTVDLGGSFNLPRGAGTAVVDGVTYPQIFIAGMTGTFSSPSFQITGAESVTITRPFSYSGVITGYLMDPWVVGETEAAFTKVLSGQGTASARFIYTESGGAVFTGTDLRYAFDSDNAPVPEPATMLLFGTGAAVLAMRRRRDLPKES